MRKVPLLPTRTREHYIEAISRNYVERLILVCGHTVEEPKRDYGYDLVVTTFDYQGDPEFRHGDLENGNILIQVKATDNVRVSKRDGQTIAYPIERRHALLWAREPMPVYLIVYSVPDTTAYYLHMQSYLRSPSFQWPPTTRKKITVYLPRAAVLNEQAVEEFRRYKATVVESIAGDWRP